MRRAALVLAVVAGCSGARELTLNIRVAEDPMRPGHPSPLLAAVTRLDVIATRDNHVLAQSSTSAPASSVSVAGVSHGPRTVISLEGFTSAGDVVAVGRTCAIDFEKSGMTAPLFFAPTNFFALTGNPVVTRADPIVIPLDDGSVLLAGGASAASALDSVEHYLPDSATFSATAMSLSVARAEAETTLVPGFGALITGGVGSDGQPVPVAEIYNATLHQFATLSSPILDARVEHRAVLLPDGRVLLSGGRSPTTTLASTAFVRLTPTMMQVLAGPPLVTARREHAVVIANVVPVVIGGYAVDGSPLSGIETLLPSGSFSTIAGLVYPRAEATATVLLDGTILVVGGAGDASGTPRRDAELFNPVTRATTIYPMQFPRRGHTATLLPDGRVLIVGGFDLMGQPQRDVELFVPGIGFVLEHKLTLARAGHAAVPLCDGTVLVVGGNMGAELYTPPTS